VPASSSQPDSRSLTTGHYCGNNATFNAIDMLSLQIQITTRDITMNKLTKIVAAQLCALAVLACPLAKATLVAQDAGSFRDTDSHYVWRTLGQYDNMSYTEAVNALPTGFHVATEAELATLTAAAPAGPLAGFMQDAAVMGASIDPDNPMIWGFYGDGTRYAWLTGWGDGFDTWTSSTANASGWDNADIGKVQPNTRAPYLSLFAVDTAAAQTSVPEPATLALVGLGLAGIARRRRAGKPARQA
jgi:hypothetical protein